MILKVSIRRQLGLTPALDMCAISHVPAIFDYLLSSRHGKVIVVAMYYFKLQQLK